jgi:hypothetical protein
MNNANNNDWHPLSNMSEKQLSTMSPQDLLDYIRLLCRKILQEQQRKQQLESTIQQLEEGIQLLTQKVNEIVLHSSSSSQNK